MKQPYISALLALFFGTFLFGCHQAPDAADSPSSRDTARISIATLLASPDAYQGKTVQVAGPAVGMFEVSFICDDLATIERGNGKECLWLEPDRFGFTAYHNKIVEVTGRFNKDYPGHMSAYGATIVASSIRVLGTHKLGTIPPPPPEPKPE